MKFIRTSFFKSVTIQTFLFVIPLAIAITAFVYCRMDALGFLSNVDGWKTFLSALKIIWAGTVVGLVGLWISSRSAEIRSNFERLKESRIAYSKAKTGVAYLPLRLSALDFKDAGILLQHVHFWKHQAELYEELKEHVALSNTSVSVEVWRELIYQKLAGFRDLLGDEANQWNSKSFADKYDLLLKRQRAIECKLILDQINITSKDKKLELTCPGSGKYIKQESSEVRCSEQDHTNYQLRN